MACLRQRAQLLRQRPGARAQAEPAAWGPLSRLAKAGRHVLQVLACSRQQ